MKFRPAWTMGVVVLLVCASLFAVRIIDRLPTSRLASLMGITVTVSDLSATSSPSPRVTPAGGDQSSLYGSVAIQTFAGPRLVRQGPGTAVTADGLILAVSSVAPYGSGSFVYQVATPRGQLLRAHRVASDQSVGLTLLKVDVADGDAVLFDATDAVFAGQDVEAVSGQVMFSKFVSQRMPVWIAWSSDAAGVSLSMDRSLGTAFNGARLIDSSNRSVGLLRYGSGPSFVSAATINAFLEAYFARSATK